MNEFKRIAVILVSGALLVSTLTACGSGSNSNPSASGGQSTAPAATATAETNPTYVQAAELFQKMNCISCHGVNLEGKAGPKTNLKQVGASRSQEEIAAKISNGGNGMPVFKSKLSEDEINLLAQWLSSKR
ncbi:Cytochrome c-551 precursor [compost metagenome]